MNKLPVLTLLTGLSFLIYAMNPDQNLLDGIRTNNIKQIEDALNSQATITTQTPAHGSSPLHVAAAYQNPQVIELLLSRGANTNAQDNEGNTPLHHYALNPKPTTLQAIKMLLKAGADATIKNNQGQTALDMLKLVTGAPNLELVRLLTVTPALRSIAAQKIRKMIQTGTLNLEDIKDKVPEEVYELVQQDL